MIFAGDAGMALALFNPFQQYAGNVMIKSNDE